MAFVLKDRVKETSTTTGTGTYALAGAVSNFQALSAVLANGDTTLYAAVDRASGGWETGVGTWSTGNNLARTTIFESSNAGAAVSWSAGTRDVFITLPAAHAKLFDSVVEYTLSGSTVTDYTGHTAYPATVALPTLVAGTHYRAVMDFTDTSGPMAGVMTLGNGTNAYTVGLAGGAYSGSVLLYRQNGAAGTALLNPAIQNLGTTTGRTKMTLDFVVSTTKQALTVGLLGTRATISDTSPLNLTTGTWTLHYTSSGGTPNTEVHSLKFYTNPIW